MLKPHEAKKHWQDRVAILIGQRGSFCAPCFDVNLDQGSPEDSLEKAPKEKKLRMGANSWFQSEMFIWLQAKYFP